MHIVYWEPNKEYKKLDIVRYANLLFCAVEDNINILPLSYFTDRIKDSDLILNELNAIDSINNVQLINDICKLYEVDVKPNSGQWKRI